MLDQGLGVSLRIAGGRTPRRLDARDVHTQDDARIIRVCRDPRMAQSGGATLWVSPVDRGWALALSIGQRDIAGQANDVFETISQTHRHHGC